MKAVINNNIEISSVTVVTEKEDSSGKCRLIINVADNNEAISKFKEPFLNIETLHLNRGNSKDNDMADYSKYKVFGSIESRITEDSNVKIVTLYMD